MKWSIKIKIEITTRKIKKGRGIKERSCWVDALIVVVVVVVLPLVVVLGKVKLNYCGIVSQVLLVGLYTWLSEHPLRHKVEPINNLPDMQAIQSVDEQI